MSSRNITLAVESAVSGGSLSLFDGSSVIDRWNGEGVALRSEELLMAIDEILKNNHLRTKDLSLLAVSLGPGSYTSIRIGVSTAIGLKNGLDIECFGCSVFDALFYSLGKEETDLAALPFGKNEVCFQFYRKGFNKNESAGNYSEILPFEKFVHLILATSNLRLITNQKISVELKGIISKDVIINAGQYLSDYIGDLVMDKLGSDNLLPVYILPSLNKNLL